jgi:hypothetical protein
MLGFDRFERSRFAVIAKAFAAAEQRWKELMTAGWERGGRLERNAPISGLQERKLVGLATYDQPFRSNGT